MAGGGVGEAALIKAALTGAAVGGGTAIVTGQDPLKGALIGGFTGGITGGLFPGGGAGGAGSGAGANAGQAAGKLTSFVPQNVAGSGAINTVPGMTTPTYGAAAPAAAAPAGAGMTNVAGQGAINVARAGEAAAAGAGGGAAQPGFFQGLMDKYAGLSVPQKIGVGIGGGMLLSSLTSPKGIPEDEDFYNPLSYYKFDPRKYQAAYSNGGGITDLDVARNDYLAPPVTMMRTGGISDLGDYSDGGRLLRGPGDGVSDSIPARIGQKREARLADGEFVVPARIVSELGNGSTDAGARQLYAMMNRIQSRRNKTVGKGRVAVDSKARKLLPA